MGRVENAFGRAAVLFEFDHFRFGVVFFEVENVLEVGAPPGVDGVVNDDAGGREVGLHLDQAGPDLTPAHRRALRRILHRSRLSHIANLPVSLYGAWRIIIYGSS